MNATEIFTIGAGISLAGQGILMRKHQKPIWKTFLIGGIIFLVLGVLSLKFGFIN
jgi:hypothetical protein